MKFLHSMIRVKNLDESLKFYQDLLELKLVEELRLDDCTLYYLGNSEGETQIELTVNDSIPDNGYEKGNAFFKQGYAKLNSCRRSKWYAI